MGLTIFRVAKGQRVSRISIRRLPKRLWTLLIAMAVVAVAGLSVYRLRGVFGSHDNATSAGVRSNATAPRIDDTALPSSYDVITTTEPAVFATSSLDKSG
ncbi:MAG: hypothetical protein NVS4B6_15640 [Mycobacterium sp.]